MLLVRFGKFFLRTTCLLLLVITVMLLLIWFGISHSQHVQNTVDIVSQNTHLFSAFRWTLILSCFVFWQPAIKHIAERYNWASDKMIFWQNQRLKITLWLILFELVLCENLLLTLFHLLKRTYT